MTSQYRISWRSRIFSSFALYLMPTLVCLATAQNFNSSEMESSNATTEVNIPRIALYNRAQVLDHVTRQFVAAQLREYLFGVFRAFAEKEIKDRRQALNSESTTTSPTNLTTTTLRSHSYTRLPRQDDGDEDGDDGDAGNAAAGAAGAAQAAVPSRPTIPPQIGLFPQVANLVRVFFGGNQQSQVNFTNFVGTATKLLPRPLGNQVFGIVKTLANENNGNPINVLNTISSGPLNGLPPNFNPQAPQIPSLTQEQILALGLPSQTAGSLGLNQGNEQNGLEANGITQEQLLALGLPVGGGGGFGGGFGGSGGGPKPSNGLSQTQTKPLPGGTNNAAGANLNQELPGGLTIADIQALQALGVPDLPNIEHLLATTRPPILRSTRRPRPQYTVNKQPNPQRQQASQQQLQTLNLEQNQGQSNRFQNQEQNPAQSNRFQNQEQNQVQTNRFQNLANPNRFQQAQEKPNHLQPAQELHYPPTRSPDYLPTFVNTRNPQFVAAEKDILPLNLNPNQQSISQIQQNLQQQQGPKYQETPQSASYPNFQPQQLQQQQQPQPSNSHPSLGIGNQYGQQPLQNQNYLQQQQQQQQQQPPLPIGGGGGLGALTPQQLQQYQQFLQQQIQQGPYGNGAGGVQGQPNLQFPQNGLPPNFQPQFFLTPRTTPKPTTLSPLQHFQNFFRPPTRATTVATNNGDDDDSEEDELDVDGDVDDSRRGRQLNLLSALFPNVLGGLNRNNQNNNPQQQQQPVPQQPPTPSEQQPAPEQPQQPPNNGTTTANNQNFDLNMFAQNLGKGMGDVIRVMPDLFRGAREGLQLIQALSSILRAFPGLGDAFITA